MKKKNFFAPSQLIVLSTIGEDDGGSKWDFNAKPDPHLDEEGEVLFPDGGSAESESGDLIVTPDSSGNVVVGTDSDEAYY